MTFCIQTADVSRLLQWTMELSEHIEKFEEVHRASFVSALICSCTGQSGMVRFIFHQFWHTVMMAAWQFSSTSVTSTQLWSCLILWTTMSPKCCRLQTLPCAVFVPFSTLSIAYEYIKGGTVELDAEAQATKHWDLQEAIETKGWGEWRSCHCCGSLWWQAVGCPSQFWACFGPESLQLNRNSHQSQSHSLLWTLAAYKPCDILLAKETNLLLPRALSLCWNNSPSDAYRSFEYSFVGFSWRLFEHVVFGLRSFIMRVCLAMMVCTKWCPLVACGNACMIRLPSFFDCNAKLLTICVGLWFDVFDVSHSQPLTRSEPFQVIVACLCRHVRIAHRHTWTVCLEPTFPGPEFGAADGNRKMRNGFGIESLLKFDSSNFIDVWQRFWALQASTQKWCSLSLVASRSTRWPAALPSRNGCDQHWLSEFVRMGLLLTADIRMRAAIEKIWSK